MKKLVLSAAVLACAAAYADVVVYSQKAENAVAPVLAAFTKETGIKTQLITDRKDISKKIQEHGAVPADVILTVDLSRAQALVKDGLTQPLDDAAVNAAIPAHLRTSDWTAVALRSRVIYASKARVGKLPASFTYQDLAKPEYKGKVCIRSGKHLYNRSLIASIIAHDGEAAAKAWLTGLKANLARKPEGGDREQAQAIMDGVCDYAIGNSYYVGVMLNNAEKPEQKAWAEAITVNFPNQETTGAHMNVSVAALGKNAAHVDEAKKLITYLTGVEAQNQLPPAGYEYPANPKASPSELLASWGEFKQDDIALADIAKHLETADKLVEEVKFDD